MFSLASTKIDSPDFLSVTNRRYEYYRMPDSTPANVLFNCCWAFLNEQGETIVSAYENKASNKSALDEEPVYEEIDSEHNTQNRMNNKVIYGCSIIEPKTRAKQAGLNEYEQMTTKHKMSPYEDDQRDTSSSNLMENEIIKKDTKGKKMESEYLDMRPKYEEINSENSTKSPMNNQVINEYITIEPKTRAKQAGLNEYVQMTTKHKMSPYEDDQRDTSSSNLMENEIIKKDTKGKKMESEYLDMRPKYEEIDSENNTKNPMNNQVINEYITIEPKTRAKQAVLDEYVQMTKHNKARPKVDDQRDTIYSNQKLL
ncbi:hypothetical protein EVAR_34713_1 [Eumeta japonica]|uniref:Uncharacterized protein n=1 Tax=Eumeta variegata TaxID=151549 RepID=A0A4C1XGZ9_EUMVA|nr:hypothetical protein EVAR_34713_1 [Eumeta japonica]